jgi:L-ribulose-5-phosphate 3-epimerase
MENKLAGHTNSYHTYSLEEALRGIANAGFSYVELSAVPGWTEHVPLDATDAELDEIRDMMAHYGLEAVSMSGHSDLTSTEGLEQGKKAVILTQKLGLDIMNTAIGGHYSEDEDESAFLENINELADFARERGVKLGIEVHGDITASGRLAREMIERLDIDNVFVNHDTANCEFYGGVHAEDDVQGMAPYMVHCHLKDKRGEGKVWDFPAIGEGHVDFEAVLNTLAEEGYEGPYSVEIEFSGEPWPPVEEVDRSMKGSYDNLRQLGLS